MVHAHIIIIPTEIYLSIYLSLLLLLLFNDKVDNVFEGYKEIRDTMNSK